MTMLTNPSTRETATTEKASAKKTMINPSVTNKPITKTPGAKLATTHHGATILKTTLAVSSVVATLMGAQLAARQAQVTVTTPVITGAYAANVAFNSPPSFAAVPNLPATTNLDAANVNSLLTMPLAPIPSITMPAPVTRSRSSR